MRNLIILIIVFSATATFAQTADDLAVDFMSMARAAKDGDIVCVRNLLGRGIDPNGYDFEKPYSDATYFSLLMGRPIQMASENGHIDTVKLLLEKGANPNWCCCDCVTALHMAIFNGHEAIANLLIENGADTDLPFSTKDKTYKNCLELALDKGLESTAELIRTQNKLLH